MFPALRSVFCVLVSLFTFYASADVGDRSLGWSGVEANDFQDYAIRSFNKQRALKNDYWSYYWLNQKIIELDARNARDESVLPIFMNDNNINAFAIPGSVVGFNAGLVELAETESEFLSVVAHELAHVRLDHFARQSDTAGEQNMMLLTGILLAILLAQENPEAANAALFATIGATSQVEVNYSQAMELEADQLAQSLMNDAGFNPDAGRDFFRRMEQNSNAGNAYEFLRTHPLFSTRAAALTGDEVSSEQPPTDNIEAFEIIRARLTGKNVDELKTQLNDWARLPSDVTDPNIKLAWAMVKHETHEDSSRYLADLNELIRQHRTFYPAHLERLTALRESDDPALCQTGRQLTEELFNSYLTLDAIVLLRETATECALSSQSEWYAKWLWQSGKDVEALSFLRNEVQDTSDVNQAARLTTTLAEYDRRYQRYR